MDWPDNPFWDYALDLYRRPGVEQACLELQNRHRLDVNIVLLCCWLGARGIEVQRDWLERVAATADRWQTEVVRPLRAVRTRLKASLAESLSGTISARWPGLTAGLRKRVLAAEIDGERLEQLLLAELAAGLPAAAEDGISLASLNLRRYRPFTAEDRQALEALLGGAFPEDAPRNVAAQLGWLKA